MGRRIAMGVVTRLDAEGRLRLPEEWRDEYPPEQEVELEHGPDGLLVRPIRRSPLDAALRRKFRMNRPSHLDLSDLDMDALG
jgi:bifunctional DNA-binding transcriptional regulator/antitoxin component of YhaV-PrlF toxin-antitoxin module